MRDDVGGAVLSKSGGMVSGDPIWSKTVFTRVIDSILTPDWLAHHHVMNRHWQSGGLGGISAGTSVWMSAGVIAEISQGINPRVNDIKNGA